MIAVFTRCVIDINYVQENNLSQIINTTDLEFIGGDFTDTHEAGRYLGSYRYLRLATADGSK